MRVEVKVDRVFGRGLTAVTGGERWSGAVGTHSEAGPNRHDARLECIIVANGLYVLGDTGGMFGRLH
ncbi:hypothetical protein GCM10009066_18100 [Halarchaeum salinum]|uniref:MBL fold metallo-hydrolase n=1 Tax=Halarchaeum salinum TaxID=489912 RepID=A0AAV3S926_9EURY